MIAGNSVVAESKPIGFKFYYTEGIIISFRSVVAFVWELRRVGSGRHCFRPPPAPRRCHCPAQH